MPQQVLRTLEDGNARFAAGQPIRHDVHEALRMAATGTAPPAAILSCIDSRVPVETVFDLPIGRAFSVRVAGNVVGPDVLGSLEFACAAAGSRLVVVLGHTACGAIKGAVDGVAMGHLTGIVDKIGPALREVGETRTPAATPHSADAAFVDAVAEANVHRSMDALVAQSPILRSLLEAGAIGLVGAMYDVATGLVTFLPDGRVPDAPRPPAAVS